MPTGPAKPSVLNYGGVCAELAIILATLLFVPLLVVGFLAYLVVYTGPGGKIFDGLGRELFEVPLLLRLFWIDQWPGLGWYLIDMAVFWITLPLVLFLGSWGASRIRRRSYICAPALCAGHKSDGDPQHKPMSRSRYLD